MNFSLQYKQKDLAAQLQPKSNNNSKQLNHLSLSVSVSLCLYIRLV